MKKLYRSVYAKHISQFIALKHALGFKYKTEALVLFYIDKFAEKCGESSPGITKQFAQKWCSKRDHESDKYHYARNRQLVQFSSYLCEQGIASFIPRLPPYPENRFIPYIYSNKEIEALFQASDNLRLRILNMPSCILSLPALFRILYATGIRIGEALALTDDDINLEAAYLKIKDSKNGKERIIPISNSVVSVCQQYLYYRNKLPISKSAERFFVSLNGGKCGRNCIYTRFRECLQMAGIPYIGRHHGPRIHDLRHTFAVNALVSMVGTGLDLYVALPVLSSYLGHHSIGATEHYVRLTANIFPELIRDMDMLYLDVFPKSYQYEEGY